MKSHFLAIACLLLLWQTGAEARDYVAYAPPLAWGPWVEVANHLGPATFHIAYTTAGSTLVVGQIEYCQVDGKAKKVLDFRDEIDIATCNAVDNVRVRFKGAPTGSQVTVTIDP